MSRLEDAYALVAMSSLSRQEAAIAAHVEATLRSASFLDVERVGDNVVARTTGSHATRVLVAGHLDTVPGDAGDAVIVGDELRGVGACDMKGSIAVMLELAAEGGCTLLSIGFESITRSTSFGLRMTGNCLGRLGNGMCSGRYGRRSVLT